MVRAFPGRWPWRRGGGQPRMRADAAVAAGGQAHDGAAGGGCRLCGRRSTNRRSAWAYSIPAARRGAPAAPGAAAFRVLLRGHGHASRPGPARRTCPRPAWWRERRQPRPREPQVAQLVADHGLRTRRAQPWSPVHVGGEVEEPRPRRPARLPRLGVAEAFHPPRGLAPARLPGPAGSSSRSRGRGAGVRAASVAPRRCRVAAGLVHQPVQDPADRGLGVLIEAGGEAGDRVEGVGPVPGGPAAA